MAIINKKARVGEEITSYRKKALAARLATKIASG
jgi:hypothetical protein